LRAASGIVARSLTCAIADTWSAPDNWRVLCRQQHQAYSAYTTSGVLNLAFALRQALKERALVPRAPPSRAQLLTCAFLAGVLITAVRVCCP
jgi:hypothetical protein